MLSTNSKVFNTFQIFMDVAIVWLSCFLSGAAFGGQTAMKTLAVGALTVLLFYFLDLYSLKKKKISDDIVSIVIAVVISFVLYLFLSVFVKSFMDNPRFVICAFALELVFFIAAHALTDAEYIKIMNRKKVLIIDSTVIPSRLARKIKYSFPVPENVHYFIVDEKDENSVDELFSKTICHYDSVILSSGLSVQLHQRLFNYCMRNEKAVSSFLDLEHATIMNGTVRMYGDTAVVVSNPIHLSRIQLAVKRAFDVVCSAVLLVLTSPFFAVCALAVKLDSPGPVIYRQERYTIGKKKFNCLKFRTMIVDSEVGGARLSTKNDDRLTRVGRVIRAARLDELPQLVNVFRGEMSFVGPRPERPIFADFFCENVKNYELRYLVKAGITGSAQVYGNYNTRASDKILLDLMYAVNYSLLLDVKLILMTIRQVFIHSSAEGDDEEFEEEMNKTEREIARRGNRIHGDGQYEENIGNHSCV